MPPPWPRRAGPSRARRGSSRPAGPACSPSATSGPTASSASPPPWARARSASSSSTKRWLSPWPRRRLQGRDSMPKRCTHLDQVKDVAPNTPDGCEECLAMGSDWVHLRLCLSCGHVGCCDDSPNRHATKHFRKIHHPIIRSLEPGEDWGWCFVDEVVMEPAPVASRG